MPKHVEFTFQDHKFRHKRLGGITIARELEKLLVRIDRERGMVNMLAFTFDATDYAEIAALGPAGLAKLLRLLSTFLGLDDDRPSRSDDDAVETEGDEAGASKEDVQARDTLPRSLEELLVYYAQLGEVEACLALEGGDEKWVPLQSADDLDGHPLAVAPFVILWNVGRALLVPFAEALRASTEGSETPEKAPSEPS